MWQSIKVPFLTIFISFVAIFIFTKIFGPIPLNITSTVTNKQNLFAVSEFAEVAAIPETASISIGVNKKGISEEILKSEVDKTINQITSDLKQIGVDEKDIKTNNYSVFPSFENKFSIERSNEFVIDVSMTINFNSIDQANKGIDIASNNGANNIGGIQFILGEEQKIKLQKEARSQAINKAKEKANDLANEAGIRLGRIIDIQEYNNEPPIAYDSMSVEKSLSTNLNPGENKVMSNITLYYETH